MAKESRRGDGQTKERLLLVDDDEKIRSILGGNLGHLGYEVTTAEDADSARAVLKKNEFDIAVLDVMMPGGASGIYLTAWIHAEYPELPLVVMSGEADGEMVADAMKHGAADFIKKPFKPQELDRRIKSVLAKARKTADSEQSTGETEREQIVKALEKTRWNRKRAAELLGMSYSTLNRRIKDYGIDDE